MKRFIIACVVLVVIIGGCVFALFHFNLVVRDVSDQLNGLEAAVKQNNLPEADRLTKDFISKWMKTEKRLSLYINHSVIDEITWSAASLPAYLASHEIGEYLALVGEMRAMLVHIYEGEMPSFYNMF